MCQLLGMNCNTPTDITFSFKGFRYRGGETDIHRDGFGIAFFEAGGLRLFHDDKPCAESPIADLIEHYPIQSENIIAHIRKASRGEISIANTHPFMREIWGEYWVFAHNGHIENHEARFPIEPDDYYQPVGNTDSEAIFCYLLNRIRHHFPTQPSPSELIDFATPIIHTIRQAGIFNFLLSNGVWQIAHASTLLHYIIREAPFGKATLADDDFTIDFSAVTTPKDRVAVIATLPLTSDERWEQLAVNEVLLFHQGRIIARRCPKDPRYLTIEEGLQVGSAQGIA